MQEKYKNVYSILLGNHTRKCQLRNSRRRRDCKETGHALWPRFENVGSCSGSCEESNEPSGTIKGGKFTD